MSRLGLQKYVQLQMILLDIRLTPARRMIKEDKDVRFPCIQHPGKVVASGHRNPNFHIVCELPESLGEA